MVVEDYRIGIGGGTIAKLLKRNRTLRLPWNRLRPGSPVVVSDYRNPNDEGVYGIVVSRTAGSIEIATNDWLEPEILRIELSADEISRERQKHALQKAENCKGRAAQLRDILLERKAPAVDSPPSMTHASNLNLHQKLAIENCLACRDIGMIHGPPGTGKTTTLVELLFWIANSGKKVLATAPSNAAVDNLLEKLDARGVETLRLGHPARVQESLQHLTLDAKVESDPAMDVVRAMRKEAERSFSKAEKFTRGKPAPGYRKELRSEARSLLDDAKLYERQIIESIIDSASVVCATTTFDPEILGERHFDWVAIDEAGQCTEASAWPSILRGDRIVMAGDPMQLPPTILSSQCVREGMGISLMERLIRVHGNRVSKQLTEQFRMHDQIMRFPSKEFYHDTLVASPSVVSHLLIELPGVTTNEITAGTVTFIDTAGTGWEEETDSIGESRFNSKEGRLTIELTDQLIQSGVLPQDIGVITPYSAQVKWIRERLTNPYVEVDSVDGFQGREKEVILISLVRSNDRQEIGFLADTRRMNVAMTRARRRLIVIGDSSTIASNEFYSRFLQYIDEIGVYRSAWEWHSD